MSEEIFNLSWFIIFILVIIIAFLANIIIISATLSDRSMHTSTYFYIINVNIADILLVLSCLPERLATIFRSPDGFHLGMFTCYLLPFLQQVSMHAALGFLLILTVHRCYPAGVPRCLQGNFIRRQIRQHFQTLIFIWILAIVINLPLFAITKYDRNGTRSDENASNHSEIVYEATCETEATEIWSRTYLILLLVSTYLITGVFLIVIYGQVIRIILASKKYTTSNAHHSSSTNGADQSRFLSAKFLANPDKSRSNGPRSSTSSTSTNASHRRQQQQQQQQQQPPPTSLSANPLAMSSLNVPSAGRQRTTKDRRNSHSAQHLQVIVMLFIVILLYILLLLPYRLLNLLYIVHNQLFQQSLMNEILFQCLVNTVRLLVFLNCALQPITYIIISSRLRQTVMKFLQTLWQKCSCRCRCAVGSTSRSLPLARVHDSPAHLSRRSNRFFVYREQRRTGQPTHLLAYQNMPLNRTLYTVTFNNTLRK